MTDGKWYFANRQWIVTDYGIEPLKGVPYAEIAADRLLEVREQPDDGYYDLPLHMVEKEWADISVFINAWLAAINHFHRDVIDWEMVARTIRKAMASRIATYETLLGVAADRIPGFYEPPPIKAYTFDQMDTKDRNESAARERWRRHQYSLPPESDGEDIEF